MTTENTCRCQEEPKEDEEPPPSYRSKYGQFDDVAININKTLNAPVIEAKAEKYTPLPYVFRIPDASPSNEIHAKVRCPPFHVQLDHAIAVIWSLYSSDETEIPLGINQLHWAYGFLRNVKDPKSSAYPADVQHCLNSITDELIRQYAQLAELDSEPSACSSSITSIGRTCPCKKADDKSSDESPCSPQSRTSTLKYPFSITYNDMKLHNYVLQEQEAKRKKDICLKKSLPDWLANLRKQQLLLVLDELDKLQSIEDYLAASDEDFMRYLDEDDGALKDYIHGQLGYCQRRVKAEPSEPEVDAGSTNFNQMVGGD